MHTRVTFLVAAFALARSVPAFAAVRYVRPGGAGNCTSWADACTLPAAMNLAAPGDEVRVQAGTYPPFFLKDGVKVIGGFAGNETSAAQSNPRAHPTIVDGGGTSQCVGGTGNPPSTVLRGFTIRNGISNEGGGLHLQDSNALIVDCVFANNKATWGGAVAIGGDGVPQFINCTFRNNGDATGTLPFGGGALYAPTGSPVFVNCVFHNNKAGEGGAAFLAYLVPVFANPVFTNCTFTDNESTIGYGGAIFDPEGQATLRNSIVWHNTAGNIGGSGSQIYTGSGGTSTAYYCDIQGGWPSLTTIDADPLFVNVATANYILTGESPCRDTAETAALPADAGDLDWDDDVDEPVPYDLAFKPRVRGAAVDIGAYEVQCDGPCTGACCDHSPLGECSDAVTAPECDCPDCEWFEKAACADVACVRQSVPTLSAWGIAILTLLLLCGARIRFGCSR